MRTPEIIELADLLSQNDFGSNELVDYLKSVGPADAEIQLVHTVDSSIEILKVIIKGTEGAFSGGTRPTLGIVSQLSNCKSTIEGIGCIDMNAGVFSVLVAAYELLHITKTEGGILGDVMFAVFIGSDVTPKLRALISFLSDNSFGISQHMDAVLSVGTSKFFERENDGSIAVSPTVKEGYILKISDDILDVFSRQSNQAIEALTITQQDIIPTEKGMTQRTNLLQPSTKTSAPVVGISIGSSAALSNEDGRVVSLKDIGRIATGCLDIARSYGANECVFYDEEEFTELRVSYGNMSHFQGIGWGHHFTGLKNAPHLLWRHLSGPEANDS